MSQKRPGIRGLLQSVLDVVALRERLGQQWTVPLYRNAIYLMMNYVVTGASGMAFWVIAAKVYMPEDVGLASATISALLLLALVASLGLDYALVRFLPASGKDSSDLINSSLTITAIVAAAVSAVFVLGLRFWSPALLFMQERPAYGVAFVAFGTVWTLFLVQARTLVARRRADLNLAQAIVFNLLRMALLIPLTAAIGMFGMVCSWGAAVVVAFVIGAFILQPRAEPDYRPTPVIRRKLISSIFRFSAANYLAVLLWSAPIYVMPLMVANMVGADFNAYFQIAWQIANVIFQIPIAVSFSMLAEGSSDEDNLGQHTRRSVGFAFLLVVPAILLVVLFTHRLLAFFGTDYAGEGTGVLRLLAVSAIPVTINQLYFMVERVGMAMRRLVILHMFIAAATLTICAILLPHIGIIGAGVAWLSSQSVAALAATFFWWRDHVAKRGHSTAAR
ncbi:MAG: lipopolysaccharide biosynthesis protein [Dehalococcoidia bacterium]|nr:lipopolysaccharide biosynthesis protein [Dehalococcoidia bacterium]